MSGKYYVVFVTVCWPVGVLNRRLTVNVLRVFCWAFVVHRSSVTNWAVTGGQRGARVVSLVSRSASVAETHGPCVRHEGPCVRHEIRTKSTTRSKPCDGKDKTCIIYVSHRLVKSRRLLPGVESAQLRICMYKIPRMFAHPAPVDVCMHVQHRQRFEVFSFSPLPPPNGRP